MAENKQLNDNEIVEKELHSQLFIAINRVIDEFPVTNMQILGALESVKLQYHMENFVLPRVASMLDEDDDGDTWKRSASDQNS